MTQAQIDRRGRQTRIGLLLLRVSGFTHKEAVNLLGISQKNGEHHWERVIRKNGTRCIWRLAEMVRAVPQAKWALGLLALTGTLQAVAQNPPMPPVDTNAVQVGSVSVAWDGVLGEDPAVAWYGLYSGANSNSLASTVIVSSDETNASVPLYNYGTNWIAATSIDASLLESDPSPAISYTLTFTPPTNIVSVSLACSSNLVDWAFVQTLLTLTNPSGNRFYRLAITNSATTQ